MDAMNEFQLIGRFFTGCDADALLGVGDDAAILAPTPGHVLHAAVDTMVCGRHFFADVDPGALGHKALAVNLSDMAAMGARPRWALLSLVLPDVDPAWLEAFANGLRALAGRHGVSLVGGDTTRGPLTVSVTILGETPVGKALCRHGARRGDDIWVSGRLGLAALAVRCHENNSDAPPKTVLDECRRVLDLPTPRLALGAALLDVAHACIDVSDGLLADLGHILERSRLGGEVWLDALPTHPWLAARRESCADLIAAGGDDYELCFTAPVSARADIEAMSVLCPVARIGRIDDSSALRLLDAGGRTVSLGSNGFDHFQNQA
jgi:thiamine-monophosphate kinase